jgi:MurNAc alpha-1-phosphate uridylyltransferase
MAKVAMLFAAGRGERLKPLTENSPKPLLPLGQSTILGRILDQLEAQSFERVVVNAWYLKDQVIAYLAEEKAMRPFELLISSEESLLGTGGGLRQALPLLGQDSFFVLNGDITFEMDWVAFERLCFPDPAGDLGLWALCESKPDQTPILCHDAGLVTGIGELWKASEIKGSSSFGFSGIQWMTGVRAEDLPKIGCLVRDYLIPQMKKGRRLRGVSGLFQFWEDLGTPERYQFWHRQLQNERGLR